MLLAEFLTLIFWVAESCITVHYTQLVNTATLEHTCYRVI